MDGTRCLLYAWDLQLARIKAFDQEVLHEKLGQISPTRHSAIVEPEAERRHDTPGPDPISRTLAQLSTISTCVIGIEDTAALCCQRAQNNQHGDVVRVPAMISMHLA